MNAGGPNDFRDFPEEQEDDLLTIIPERMMPDEGPYDEPRKGRSLLMAAALIGLAVAGAAGYFMLGQSGGSADGKVAAPTIPASTDPYKVRPADPGGMQVPNQDKLVYERIDSTNDAGSGVEKLLPEPVTPSAPVLQAPAALQAPPVVQAPAPVEAPVVAAETPVVPVPPVLAPTAPVSVVEAPPQPVVAPAPVVEAPKPAATKVEDKPASPNGQVAAVVAGAPAVTTGGYMIQLAALRDEASAKKSWANLQAKNPDLLGGLSLKIEKADLGEKGVFYRVRGAGIATEEKARSICTELTKRNVGCLFVGK